MKTPLLLDIHGTLASTKFSKVLGNELRRIREAYGWTRAELVAMLPSGIGDRTLLSYEHGTRQLTILRFMELCYALRVDASNLQARAMQKCRVHLEYLLIQVDLRAMLRNNNTAFRPLRSWARNSLNEYPDGIIEIEPIVVRNLAFVVGCTVEQMADYLARFLPETITVVSATGDTLESLLLPEED